MTRKKIKRIIVSLIAVFILVLIVKLGLQLNRGTSSIEDDSSLSLYDVTDPGELGELNKKTIDKDQVIIKVNGESITRGEFDFLKISNTNQDEQFKKSNQEIIEQLIQQELFYTETLRLGYSISEDEVNRQIETAKQAIEENKETLQSFQAYLKRLNMSEGEYWEKARRSYEHLLLEGKYKNEYLKNEFSKKGEKFDTFQQFIEYKVKELQAAADIEYVDQHLN